MKVLQTTLLTGPYDYDPAVLPRAEFDGRLARVRAAFAAQGAAALLVHGYGGDYGALNYLTGFAPKLGTALALVPMDGPIRLLVSGADLMLPYAKRLTWVEDVRTLANVPKLVLDWLDPASEVTLASWGAATLPHQIHRGIEAALRPAGRIVALDKALDPIRRAKSPRELELMRAANRILGAAATALTEAARAGSGNRAAALAAERAAVAAGAQDVRVLVGARPGGPPLPLDGPEDVATDPLLAAIFVQYVGYWAEGLVTAASAPGQATARAEAALTAMLREVRPGATGAALMRAAATRLAPYAPHRMTDGTAGTAIGLSLEEGVLGGDAALVPGGVYALHAGAQGEASDAAIVSATVAVTADGADILWRR